jgi:hypothetical protein
LRGFTLIEASLGGRGRPKTFRHRAAKRPRLMPPLAFAPGFEPGGTFSVLLVFLGVVLLAAARALTVEENSLFSASVVYLALGLAAAGVIHALGIRWINPFEKIRGSGDDRR